MLETQQTVEEGDLVKLCGRPAKLTNIAHNLEYLIPMVKHVGIMWWQCFSSAGRGKMVRTDGKIDGS